MIQIEKDVLIELVGLKDEAAGTFINDATVEVTLLDKETGAEIDGQTWPHALAYVAGSAGNYRGILTDALQLTPEQRLVAVVDAVKDANTGHWEIPEVARLRDV